jgi:uncharacterized membrane protein
MINTNSHHQLFYLKLLAVALVIFGARLWLIEHFGSSVPFWDQWDGEARGLFLPWLNHTLTWAELLSPHNEHRILMPRLLYLLLFIINGQEWNPLLEMVINAGIVTFTALLLIVILNHLLGSAMQNGLLLSITLLWSLPYSWENTLSGFQSAFYLTVLFSLLTLWGLLFQKNWTVGWWLGAFAAMMAYFSLASGFFILLVIIILKSYLIIIDSANRKTHLPTLFISIIITILCIILLLGVPQDPTFKTTQINDFFLTLGKTLAWPWVTLPWFSLLIYLPFLVLVFRLLWLRRLPSNAELMILALGGWVILQATATAYARGLGGQPPASRYMDILVLGIVANLLASYLMTQPWYGLSQRLKLYLIISISLWGLLVIVGLGWLMKEVTYPYLQLRQSHNIEQLKNTREFMRTGELAALKNKPPLHIPYPHAETLAGFLTHPKIRSILPHNLSVPPPLPAQTESIFVANGFSPLTEKYQNETVLGSYNHVGNSAMGQFESTPIKLSRDFLAIPVAGYLGEKDLHLQLKVEGETKPIIITPPKMPGESWVTCYVATPKKPFQVIAIDNNPNVWFAFATPRGLNTFSLMAIWLIDKGKFLFIIGLLFSVSILVLMMSHNNQNGQNVV